MSDAFDSELCDVMSRALTKALNEVKSAHSGVNDESAKAALTRGIVEAALHGERDERKLAERGLAHLADASRQAAE